MRNKKKNAPKARQAKPGKTLDERDKFGIEVVDADVGAFEAFADSVSSPWRVFFLGLVRGAGFGLGTLIGGAILLTLITYLISVLSGIPIVGEWVKSVVDNIASNMK